MQTVDGRPDCFSAVVHSTYSASGIEALLREHYGFEVDVCELVRNGFNDTYAATLKGGREIFARVAGRLYRGKSNCDYELQLLEHLAGKACVVAPVRATDGRLWIAVDAPEGTRPLTVFDKLDGDYPRCADDHRLVGAGLAKVHAASRYFTPPANTWPLDAAHLIRDPLKRILALRHLSAELRERIAREADVLAARFDNGTLTIVNCHGDCHGGNSHIRPATDSEPASAWLFDFDDGGPGLQSYDLAVHLWALLIRKHQVTLDREALGRWQAFIEGYTSVSALEEQDWRAIAHMVPIRQLWLMGEYAGRTASRGTQAVPQSWFTRMTDLLEKWRDLTTPGTPDGGDELPHEASVRALYR